MKTSSKHLHLMAALAIFTALSACSSTGDKHSNMEEKAVESKTAAAEATAPAPLEIYEVHHDGRINVFYDRTLYMEFLDLGETSFRLTRIGEGPNGETVVYGLTKHDKKKPESVEALKVYQGSAPVPEKFYGELRNHGRIYVFDNMEDMKPVRQFGHPNFFYTEIASGPKGETVVYVLNKHTKKKRPDNLIAQFKKMNNMM